MSIEDYFEVKKEFYDSLIEFIDNENEQIESLTTFFTRQIKNQNISELKRFLELIAIISNYHHRSPSFFSKIEKILVFFKDEIKQKLNKTDIFNLFIKCRRSLLILFKNKILEYDKTIFDLLLEQKDTQKYQFFYPEIKNFLDEETFEALFSKYEIINPDTFEDFEAKRDIGENDSYICQLIRNDSVIEFITFTQKTNANLSQEINYSIFETNSFLLDKNPTLIEYAAFFGSIQIFQYLQKNDVNIDSSIILYAIHGKNPEMIHLIESMAHDSSIESFNINKNHLKEAIKCHHNDVANYFVNNYLDNNKDEQEEIKENFFNNIYTLGFHYKNVEFYPKNYDNKKIYFYLCKYNYFDLFKLLLDEKKLNLDDKITNDRTLIQLAADENSMETVYYLLSQMNNEIKQECFKKCNNLRYINIPDSFTSIQYAAFNQCTMLKEVKIPQSINSIGEMAFAFCNSLTEITIPASVTIIRSSSFSFCYSLNNIHFVDASKITEIGDFAFRECYSLSQINISTSVTRIGKYAFYKCACLRNVIFDEPSSLKEIGKFAFYQCFALYQLDVPSSVDLIAENALLPNVKKNTGWCNIY